jgi:NAD(P)H-dependent FMN reductase
MSGEKTDLGRMLGIVGSSRRGGNTETLVDEVLRGAEEAGALVEKVILSELDIAPCRACDTCRRTGSCVQQDDMPAVMEQMRRSSVWVLGTPVYWWGPTAQFKAFLARWYVGGDVISRREGQRVIVVIPLGDTRRHGSLCSGHVRGRASLPEDGASRYRIGPQHSSQPGIHRCWIELDLCLPVFAQGIRVQDQEAGCALAQGRGQRGNRKDQNDGQVHPDYSLGRESRS